MAGYHVHACSHHHAGEMSAGRLRVSLALTLGFVLLEAIVAVRAHSLALLSDAGHNFTDAFALALSGYAVWIARKPASSTRTYGYHRVGILTALFNATLLLVIAALIFREAIGLLVHPPAHIESLWMMGVAAVAILLNGGIALSLRGEAAHDVNIRSAFVHMAGDALSAAGVVVAGAIIHWTGWVYADPLVSMLIGLFIVTSSWGILVETVNILLEGTPRGMDVEALATAIRSMPGVADVHDLHVWAIAEGMNALSCHLLIQDEEASRAAAILEAIKERLAAEYGVAHSTIETECGGCDLNALYCSMPSHR
ncbi:MAG TPA: cation diffusion facilitator family transporter [Chthonomonadaceae bacterium]|nr:cation diffusion facilitator family transporter [Chthonomonadaceae bacterium]